MKNTGTYRAIDFIKQKYDIVVLVFAIAISLVIRFCCKDFVSEDFTNFLSKWVDFYRENGGFSALKDFEGDYNVLYQYVIILISYLDVSCLHAIKFVSVIFDYLLAFACIKCLDAMGVDKKKQNLCFSLIVLIPTVLINSSLWGQCDSIYVSFIVWSLYFLIRKKNIPSVIMIALAFALKLQTVFVMPVYLLLLLKKEIKLWHLFVFPAVYLIVYMPALIFGKSLSDIIEVYATQTKEYPLMVMNSPTIFNLLGIYSLDTFLEKLFIVLAGVFVLAVVLFGLKSKKLSLIEVAFMLSLGVPFLLPHMHERYFYPALILAVMCAFYCGKKYGFIAACIEISSLICYFNYFEIVNKYFGKCLSYVFSTYVSVVLMVAAFVMAIVFLIVKTKKVSKIAVASVIPACILAVVILINTHCFVTIDGKIVNFSSTDPFGEKREEIMLPLRNFSNAVGGEVYYDEETHRITVDYNGGKILFASGENPAMVNGEEVETDGLLYRDGYSYISLGDAVTVFDLDYEIKSKNAIAFYKN